MKNLKLILLGLAALLFGVCAILLAGLQGTPTYHNGFWELTGVIFPLAGLLLCIFGYVRKDQ